ncbi:MAG: glycine cleavage T C-terminal barrel domain-containing protein, partial [Actinomycetes bacterium]
FVAYDKPAFIGREAVVAARATTPERRLALLAVDALDADASGDEGVWHEGELVGFTTSGAYGHHVRQSLVLAYVDSALVDAAGAPSAAELTVDVVGEPRPAHVLVEPPYDPTGSRLRS